MLEGIFMGIGIVSLFSIIFVLIDPSMVGLKSRVVAVGLFVVLLFVSAAKGAGEPDGAAAFFSAVVFAYLSYSLKIFKFLNFLTPSNAAIKEESKKQTKKGKKRKSRGVLIDTSYFYRDGRITNPAYRIEDLNIYVGGDRYEEYESIEEAIREAYAEVFDVRQEICSTWNIRRTLRDFPKEKRDVLEKELENYINYLDEEDRVYLLKVIPSFRKKEVEKIEESGYYKEFEGSEEEKRGLLESLHTYDLKKTLEKSGLKKSGTKEELIDRVIENNLLREFKFFELDEEKFKKLIFDAAEYIVSKIEKGMEGWHPEAKKALLDEIMLDCDEDDIWGKTIRDKIKSLREKLGFEKN